MTADLLKQIEVCWKTLISSLAQSSDQPQQQITAVAQQLILSTLCLALSEQRGISPAGHRQAKCNLHLSLCQRLQSVCDWFKLPIPSDWLSPPFLVADEIVRPVLLSLGNFDFQTIPVAVLGLAYEKCLSSAADFLLKRKSGGVYYTPEAIADYIAEQTVDPQLSGGQLPHVLDPACGGGIFLLTAYQHLLDWHLKLDQPSSPLEFSQAQREQILLNCIYGVDLDPQAVAITQISLMLKLIENLPSPQPLPDLSRNIQYGNAVIGPDFFDDRLPTSKEAIAVQPLDWHIAFPSVMQAGGFDAVIGNPPYLDAERMTACFPQWRTYCVQHYQTAAGNWDLFCVFIEKALCLCRSGGLTSMIVPNKLMSAAYASPARLLLAQTNQLLCLRDYSRTKAFAVAVYPLVYVTQKGAPRLTDRVRCEVMTIEPTAQRFSIASTQLLAYEHFLTQQEWLLTALPQLNLFTRLQQNFSILADFVQVTGAATVAEAYELRPLIHEAQTLEVGDLRLVNSGTIDRYCSLWGKKQLRYLGSVYRHPVIPKRLIAQLPLNRYRQAAQPKLIVTGMAKQLECMLDESGTVLAGKSTTVITGEIDLHCLLGVLNSRLINLYFTHRFSGNQLQGEYLRIGAPQLRQIPLPTWDKVDDRSDYRLLKELVEQIIALHQFSNPEAEGSANQQRLAQIQVLDRQIDQLVYKLYRLTDAEIEVIESKSQGL